MSITEELSEDKPPSIPLHLIISHTQFIYLLM